LNIRSLNILSCISNSWPPSVFICLTKAFEIFYVSSRVKVIFGALPTGRSAPVLSF
jgi:hypothetical protein